MIALAAICTCAVLAMNDPPRVFDGPFPVREALTFYLVNEAGVDFTITMRWQFEHQERMDWPTLIRVFDPDERLLLRHDEPGLRTVPAPHHEVQLPITTQGRGGGGGPGVYQVSVRNFGGAVTFATDPPMPFGLFGYPRLGGRGDQFADSYIYLPPKLESMRVRVEGEVHELLVTDDAGHVRLNLTGANVGGQVSLPRDGEHIWKVQVRGTAHAPNAEYKLDFGGMPIILCPDPATARAIRASVDILDDGTICFHKFQIRAHRILEQYRKTSRSTFAVTLPNLSQRRADWLAEPVRNQLLLRSYGVYSTLAPVLEAQNLDPHSPMFGTIRAFAEMRPGVNPWNTYSRLGLSRVAQPVTVLSAVYSIDEPFNPLYRDRALRHRIIIASLQELMLLREHELPFAEFPSYPGGERAFTFAAFLRSFPLVVRDCPPIVREVWTEGLRRYADHETITAVASNVNQWAQLIVGLQHFREGAPASDAAWYGHIIKRHIDWIIHRTQWELGFMEAGYFNDNEGPDATYVGITLHALGWVFERTRDPELGEAIRQCLDFFNHTIAPQPAMQSPRDRASESLWLGASTFNHRTSGNWTNPQFGAGIGMLADDFTEAAPLLGRAWLADAPPRNTSERRHYETELTKALHYLDQSVFTLQGQGMDVVAGGPEIYFPVWQHFAKKPLEGQLPMVAEREFTRAFGDELFCVRRPRYYAFLYAGQPMGEWQKERRPTDPRRQYQRNGGGLSMFWSPAFGCSILGQNWAAYSAHSIIAERERSTHWEDYWSITNEFDAVNATATVRGSLHDQPLHFTRAYQFATEYVECALTLQATDAGAHYRALWECFPYPTEANLQVTLLDDEGRPVRQRPASAMVFRKHSNEAHVIVFAQPRRCVDGADHATDAYGQPRTYRRVLAELPASWDADQQREVRWRIMPVPASQVTLAVRDAIAAMNEAIRNPQ